VVAGSPGDVPHPRRRTVSIHVKRIYEDPGSADGFRVLVDGLWPRGFRKEDARIDLWLKEVAPSAALRKWFGHDPSRWDEFRKRYSKELGGPVQTAALQKLRSQAKKRKVTLLYAAKDEAHNNAVCLAEYLNKLDS
jgi:uncharacterized protein YeaO (DUF488 family)